MRVACPFAISENAILQLYYEGDGFSAEHTEDGALHYTVRNQTRQDGYSEAIADA